MISWIELHDTPLARIASDHLPIKAVIKLGKSAQLGVPVANPIRLAVDREWAMLLLDVGFVQTDLWNGDRPAAVASCA